MMTAKDIYLIALSIMDEEGSAEYERRVPGLLNTLIAEAYTAGPEYNFSPTPEGRSGFKLVTALGDEIEGLDRAIAFILLPFGLASLLCMHEDPVAAESLWNDWKERLSFLRRFCPSCFVPIADVYGLEEPESYAIW